MTNTIDYACQEALRKCGLTAELVHERLKDGKRESHGRKYTEDPADWLIRFLTKFRHESFNNLCTLGRLPPQSLSAALRICIHRGYGMGTDVFYDGVHKNTYIYLGKPIDVSEEED